MIHHRTSGRLVSASFFLLIITGFLLPFEFASSGKVHAVDEVVPGLNESIRKGVEFLIKNGPGSPEGFYGLSAYALLKAGEEPDSPEVLHCIEKIFGKFNNGTYVPKIHGIYESAVDLMALEAADPEKYKDEIISIAKFIVGNQKSYGGWNYLHTADDGGDTSITQYAVLALWAAERAGVNINRKVWLGVAKFQLDTQHPDGGFAYHPRRDKNATMTMTIAGVANLYLARKYLYSGTAELAPPEELVSKEEEEKEKEGEGAEKSDAEKEEEQLVARRKIPLPMKELIKKEIIVPQFSIEKDEDERLEEERKLEEEKKKTEEEKAKGDKPSSKSGQAPTGRAVSVNNIDAAIKKGLEWITDKYTPTNGGSHLYYYHYSVERLAALGNIDKLNDKDWYIEGAKWIIEKQGAFR